MGADEGWVVTDTPNADVVSDKGDSIKLSAGHNFGSRCLVKEELNASSQLLSHICLVYPDHEWVRLQHLRTFDLLNVHLGNHALKTV